MPVKLTISPPRENSPRVVEFDDLSVRIGRSSHCDIRLPFRIISGHHLTIESDDAIHYRVRDEASTNGTLLDGQPMADGRDYELHTGSRLDIVDLKIKVEMVPLLGEGVSLDKTGTIVRQMLGEALLEGTSDEVESAHFEVLAGPDKGARLVIPDDLDSARVAEGPGADIPVDSLGGGFELYREGDGFGVRPAQGAAAGELNVGGQPLTQARQLVSGDPIDAGAVRLRFVDPLESFLQELDGIVASSARPTNDRATPGSPEPRDALDTAEPAGGRISQRDVEPPGDEPKPPSKNPEPSSHRWGPVELGVLAVSVIVLGGVGYLLLSIFGVL